MLQCDVVIVADDRRKEENTRNVNKDAELVTCEWLSLFARFHLVMMQTKIHYTSSHTRNDKKTYPFETATIMIVFN